MNRAQSFIFPFPYDVPAEHWDGDVAADIGIGLPEGTPVLAVFDGTAQPQEFSLGGHTQRVVADDRTEAYYAHLWAEGRVSGRVHAGQVIGYMGTSGNAAGKPPHVHFAVGSINSNGGGTIRPQDFFAGSSPGPSPAPASPPPPTNPIGQPGGIPRWLLLLVGGALVLEFLDE